jgi:hypothetical protein
MLAFDADEPHRQKKIRVKSRIRAGSDGPLTPH